MSEPDYNIVGNLHGQNNIMHNKDIEYHEPQINEKKFVKIISINFLEKC